jgi:hypothetical protein
MVCSLCPSFNWNCRWINPRRSYWLLSIHQHVIHFFVGFNLLAAVFMSLKCVRVCLVHHVLNRLSSLVLIILSFFNPLPFKLPELFSKRISIFCFLHFKFGLSNEFRLLTILISWAYDKCIVDLHVFFIYISIVLLNVRISFI